MVVIFDKNFVEFAELKYDAEKKNDRIAQYKLAKRYAAGRSVNCQQRAFELFQKASRNGLTDAMYETGRCYEFGIGTEKKINWAVCEYKQAAANVIADVWEQPRAQVCATADEIRNYFCGVPDPEAAEAMAKEKPKTFADYLEAAENGDARAQLIVGNLYYAGNLELKKDRKKAVEWWKRSAENGNDDALERLGKYYLYIRQKEKAVIWLRKYAKARLDWRDEYLYGYRLFDRE